MRKHSTIWNYLSCKRDGKQFAVGEAVALPGIVQSDASTIPPTNLRDIRKFYLSKAIAYDKKVFQDLLTRFVVNNDQSLMVYLFTFLMIL